MRRLAPQRGDGFRRHVGGHTAGTKCNTFPAAEKKRRVAAWPPAVDRRVSKSESRDLLFAIPVTDVPEVRDPRTGMVTSEIS